MGYNAGRYGLETMSFSVIDNIDGMVVPFLYKVVKTLNKKS